MQSVDSSVNNFARASEGVILLLREAVSKYDGAIRRVGYLEDKMALLVQEVTAAEAEVKTLKLQLSSARTDAEAAKDEAKSMAADVEAFHRREEDLVTRHGEILRAFADRIFRSTKFGGLVNALVALLSARYVAACLDRVAKDFPDLNKRKYGYEVIPDDKTLNSYAELLLQETKAFPVVEALASRRGLLSADEIRQCQDDRDVHIEALLADVERRLKDEADHQRMAEVGGVSKRDVDEQMAPEVEQTVVTGMGGPNASATETEVPGGVS